MGGERARAGQGMGRIVHGCGGQLDPPSMPAALLLDGCSWGLPSSCISPGLELSRALLPPGRRRRRRRRELEAFPLLCSIVGGCR